MKAFDAKGYKEKRGEFNDKDEELLFGLLKEDKNVNQILDVGCGDGIFTRKIQDLFKESQIIAIDSSPAQISFATSFRSSINFQLADIRHFHSEKQFDCIYSFYAFPHISKSEILDALKSIKTLLKEGGKFYLFTNICLFDTSMATQEEQEMCDIIFLNDWESQINLVSIDEMKDVFKKAGFSAIQDQKLMVGAKIKDYGEMVSWLFVLE